MAGKSPIKVEMRTSSINESWSVYQRVDRAEQGDPEIPKSGDTQWPAKLGASILVHQTSCSYGRLPKKKHGYKFQCDYTFHKWAYTFHKWGFLSTYNWYFGP